MKKKIINWGILSSAKIGWEHVIPAILKSKNSKLVAIASHKNLKSTIAMAPIKSFTKTKKSMLYITLYLIIYISNQASKHAKTKKISYWKSLYH